MREVLLQIFSNDIGGPEIDVFNFFHILYFFLTMATTFCFAFFFRNKDEAFKKRVLDIYAFVIVGLYLGDFFVHPFMTGENALIVDKLPFHLCTISAVLIAITRLFPKQTKVIKNAVTILGIVGALMYITYPNGAVGGGTKAFCYKILQTFLYHGCLVTYGVLAMAYGECKLEYKKIYIELIMICSLTLISLGANASYSSTEHHYDWFFTTGSSFGMSPYVMPFIMIVIIFAMCNAIYGLYFLFKYLINRKKAPALEEAK